MLPRSTSVAARRYDGLASGSSWAIRSRRRPGKRQLASSQPFAEPRTAPRLAVPRSSSDVPRIWISPSAPRLAVPRRRPLIPSPINPPRGKSASAARRQAKIAKRVRPCCHWLCKLLLVMRGNAHPSMSPNGSLRRIDGEAIDLKRPITRKFTPMKRSQVQIDAMDIH
jgi:hypothetical protein